MAKKQLRKITVRSRGVTVDGRAVRALRDGLRLTQRKFAEKVRLSERTIENLEKGGRHEYKTVEKFVNALGIKFESLIQDSDKGRKHGGSKAISKEGHQDNSRVLYDVAQEFKALREARRVVGSEQIVGVDEETRDKYRHDLLHFLEMLAMLISDNPALEDPLRERYKGPLAIWLRLKPLQVAVTASVLRKNHPELDDDDIQSKAERQVEVSPVARLHKRWTEE